MVIPGGPHILDWHASRLGIIYGHYWPCSPTRPFLEVKRGIYVLCKSSPRELHATSAKAFRREVCREDLGECQDLVSLSYSALEKAKNSRLLLPSWLED